MTTTRDGTPRPMVVDHEALHDTFREDVLAGLALPQKRVSPKHLYDARGSALFERICGLDEYYPTRTEARIYERRLPDIAERIGPEATLIEPGAHDGAKAARVLDALPDPRAFVPIEISLAPLRDAARRLASEFVDVEIHPVGADFTTIATLPEDVPDDRRVVFFPGSTIGNLEGPERARLLSRFASLAGVDGMLLIGFDLVKDEPTLRAAYDDDAGVTAAFNKNLLERINRELEGTFDPDQFEHVAPWVDERRRIEMRLVSRAAHEVRVAGERFAFEAGEYLHTESSHKFAKHAFDAEARQAGFEPVEAWTDERGWFCVGLYEVRDTGGAGSTEGTEQKAR